MSTIPQKALRLQGIWRTPAPVGLAEDLELLAGEMVDPFASS